MKKCLCAASFAVLVVAATLLFPVPRQIHAAATSFTSCDNTRSQTTVSGSTSGTSATQIVAAISGDPIYVCSMTVVPVSGTTPTFSLVYGTGTNCGTGQTTFLASFPTAAGVPINFPQRLVGEVPAGSALCYLDGGTTPVQFYLINYAQQ